MNLIESLMSAAKAHPLRVVFPDALDERAIRAAQQLARQGWARPVLLANPFELRRYCKQLQLSAPQPDLMTRTMRLERLTPGDFAAVMRQHRFRPIESPATLISALEAECAVKEGGKASIGFL